MLDRQQAVNALWGYIYDNDITQRELAAKLGYSAATLNEWLWGKKNMSYNAIVKVETFINNWGGLNVSNTKGSQIRDDSV